MHKYTDMGSNRINTNPNILVPPPRLLGLWPVSGRIACRVFLDSSSHKLAVSKNPYFRITSSRAFFTQNLSFRPSCSVTYIRSILYQSYVHPFFICDSSKMKFMLSNILISNMVNPSVLSNFSEHIHPYIYNVCPNIT